MIICILETYDDNDSITWICDTFKLNTSISAASNFKGLVENPNISYTPYAKKTSPTSDYDHCYQNEDISCSQIQPPCQIEKVVELYISGDKDEEE